MKKSIIKKLAICSFIVLGLTSHLFAWDKGDDLHITASGNTMLANPPALANDGVPNTYVSFKKGSSSWLKIKLSDKKLIKAIKIDGEIPASISGSTGYFQGGVQKIFPSGYFSRHSGELIVDVGRSRVVTDTLYVSFSGEDLDQLKINEIEVQAEDADDVYFRKPLIVSDASDNTSYHAPEQQLVDGLPGTYWGVRSPEEWGKLHWFVQNSLKERFKYNRKHAKWQEGFVQLEMETPGAADVLKIFVTDEAEGDLSLEIDVNGQWKLLDSFSLKEKKGWLSYPIGTDAAIESIRLSVKGNKKEIGGIGEVELWGKGDYQGLVTDDLIAPNFDPAVTQESGLFVLDTVKESDSYTLTAAFRETDNANSVTLNGTVLNQPTVVPQDSVVLYEYDLTPNMLWTGDNFVGIKSSASSGFLSVHLRKNKDDGLALSPEGLPGDGRIINAKNGESESEVSLSGEYDIQRIKVYYQGSPAGSVYQKKLGPDAQIFSHEEGAIYHSPNDTQFPGGSSQKKNLQVIESGEGFVVYQGAGQADSIGFTSGSDVTEVEIWGSQTTDAVPYIRLIQPESYQSYQENELGYKAVFGITDTPNGNIRINGKKAKVYGNIFFIESNALHISRNYGLNTLSSTVVDADGRTADYDVNYINYSDSYHITLDQEGEQHYTRDNTFAITGKANGWVNNLFINDKPVVIENGQFHYDAPLDEGLNLINVTFTDKYSNNIVAYYIIKVFKFSGEIAININNPVDGIYINEPETYVSGYAKGAGLEKVLVNGEPANLKGFAFVSSSAVPLDSETNTIKVTAIDKTGYSTTKEITVYRDLIPPVVTNVTPLDGSWFSDKQVTFKGTATDDNTCYVLVNGHLAMKSGTSFLVSYPLVEGPNTINVIAVDLAGNVGRFEPFVINIDTTPPEPFDVISDHDGWTKERPEISFDTTDTGIGVSYYEVSINGKRFVRQESPYTVPFLDDGENLVSVKAVDYLGNSRIESTTLLIDTTAPDVPSNFRDVPGRDNIELRWTEDDDETVGYVITNSEGQEFSVSRGEGIARDDKLFFSYKESGLQTGEKRDYSIKAIDRAGNESDKVTISSTVGLAEVDYVEDEPTVVEYENVMVSLAKGSVPEGIASIRMKEFENEEIESLSKNPLVSPIYSFYAVTDSGEVQDSVSFSDTFVGTINYDEADIPDGYTEDSLQVYYFDTLWGTWFVVKDSLVDTENNTVLFQTDHFTEFTVQPTEVQDLSLAEYKDIEFSNFSGAVSHDPVSVSIQNGTVSTSMTDLFLPGKNGFDFAIRRLYNTSIAKTQGEINKSSSIDKNDSITDLHEEQMKSFQYGMSFGQGWVLDLPHLKYTSSSYYLMAPGGSYYHVGSLEKKDVLTDSDGDQIVLFENHEKDNFSYNITFHNNVYHSPNDEPQQNRHYNSIVSSTLIMRDGTQYLFNNKGTLDKIIDPTGAMSINVSYTEDNLIDFITDSLNRKVLFTYDSEKSDDDYTVFPHILSIQVEGSDRKVSYGYIGKVGSSDLKIPLLSYMSENDSTNRRWNYDYGTKFIKTESGSYLVSDIDGTAEDDFKEKYSDSASLSDGEYRTEDADYKAYLLIRASGPGLGTETLNYQTEKVTYQSHSWFGLTYTHDLAEFPVVATLTHGITGAASEVNSTDTYTYDFVDYEIDERRGYFNQKTTLNNGKLLTTYIFDKVKKDNPRYVLHIGNQSNVISHYYVTRENDDTYYVPINVMTTYESYIITTEPATTETTEPTTTEITTFIESRTYEYDDKQRVTYEKLSRSEDYYTETTTGYDDWGNVTTSKYTEKYGDNILTMNVENDYSSIKTNVNKHDLLFGSEVSGNLKKEGVATTISPSKTTYTYNDYGQRTSVKELLTKTPETIAETIYEYYDIGATEKGALKSITSPTLHKTEFSYEYETDTYSIIQSEEGVEIADSTTTYSFDTKKVYNLLTGTLKSYTDGEKNKTSYTYDAFGRKTSEIRPKESTEIAPQISIVYDDSLLTTTHTDAEGAVTTYTFDQKGQLKEISKTLRAVGENSDGTVITTLTYDGYGNIASINDPNTHLIKYKYDFYNRLISESYVDPDDPEKYHLKTYTYTDPTNSKTTIRENGSIISEGFDMSGNTIYRSDSAGRINQYRYDYNGNKVWETNGNGREIIYTYDSRGLLTGKSFPAISGFNGTADFTKKSLAYAYKYDYSGNLIKETQNSSDEKKNSVTEYKVNGLGKVIKETHKYDREAKSSVLTYSYDKNGNVLTVNDSNGLTTTKTYSVRNQVLTESDTDDNTTSYTYDREDRLVSMTDPRGNSKNYLSQNFTIRYTYDDLDRLVLGELPQREGDIVKPTVKLEYDLRGNLKSRTEPDGSKTEYVYDFRNRVKTQTRIGKKLDGTTVSYETQFKYDNSGNRIKVTEPNGSEWGYTYDGGDRLISETQPGGAVIRRSYDSADNLISISNGNGFFTTYAYDIMNRMISETDPLGNKTSYDYDLKGNRTRMTDPNNNVWIYQFDEMNRLEKEINSRNLEGSYTYDVGGRLKTVTDPNKTTVTYTYNNQNLPTSISYVNGSRSQSESFEYDEAGAVKSAALDGVVKRYNQTQDENGNWIYTTDPYGMVNQETLSFKGYSYNTGYGYDVMNHLTELDYSQGLSITQKWNNLGQIESVDGYASSFEYNTNGRMTGYNQGNGVDVVYSYDVKSRLKSLGYSMDGENLWSYEYVYDGADNMVSRNEDYFGYDRNDRLVSSMLQGYASETVFKVNNFQMMNKEMDVEGEDATTLISGSISLDYGASSMTVDYAYPYRMKKVILQPEDPEVQTRIDADKLTIYTAMYNDDKYYTKRPEAKITVDEDTGVITAEFEEPVFARFFKIHCHYNELDEQGNPVKAFASYVIKDRTAVKAYAMVSGRNEFYSYDGKGNRTRQYLMLEKDYDKPYSLQENSDLLKTDGEFGYAYDDNGNLIRKGTEFRDSYDGYVIPPQDVSGLDPEKYQYFEYEYDLKNRLTAVRKYMKDSETVEKVEKVASYLYDIDGYRIEKENKEGELTHFVFDVSGKILEEIDVESSQTISSVFLKSRHLARVTSDETLYYGTDHQGTTVLMTDESGTKVWTSEATPFGDAIVTKTGDRDDLALKYTGKDLDEDTGLYYYNARWYDASTGRFISEDPARDGANWYIYASNNPLKFTDPTGLNTFQMGFSITGGAVFGGTIGGGIAISINPENSFDIDIAGYTTIGIGSYIGANIAAAFDISTSENDELSDLGGDALTTGASGGSPTGGYIGASHEETYSLDGALPVSTSSITGGLGSAFEAHAFNTHTKLGQITSFDLSGIVNNIEQLAKNVEGILNGILPPNKIQEGFVNPVSMKKNDNPPEPNKQENDRNNDDEGDSKPDDNHEGDSKPDDNLPDGSSGNTEEENNYSPSNVDPDPVGE